MSTSTPGLHAIDHTTRSTHNLNKSFSFATARPPDVGPDTRLIAVCGLTDDKHQADPMGDGWLSSNFYLFHYLFSHHIHGGLTTESQIWMTSAKPKALVRKYKEFAHGEQEGEQRVVLDETMLLGIEQSRNLVVVPRNNLLEHFLSTLHEQALLTKNENQNLVVLIFAHGDLHSFGMAIGQDKPNLTMESIKCTLQPDTPATLFMTSSFSWGWIVQPNPMACKYNCQVLGNSNIDAIIDTHIIFDEPPEVVAEIRKDPTYIALARSIHHAYEKIRRLDEEQAINFCTEDDRLERHLECRSGISLSQLQSRWESLRLVSVDKV